MEVDKRLKSVLKNLRFKNCKLVKVSTKNDKNL